MNKSLTCKLCRSSTSLHSVHIATAYETTAKSLIWQLKLAGTQSAALIMAQQMSAASGSLPKGGIMVPVPTATSRVRQRGYDQARLLARELSKQTSLSYADCLVRLGQTHQHGLPSHQRLEQLKAAFRVTRAYAIREAHVILVDDVMTTGATLEAAAEILYAAGAAKVSAVVFAQPLKLKN